MCITIFGLLCVFPSSPELSQPAKPHSSLPLLEICLKNELHLRNRKHVPCFYWVIETQVEVLENKKCCGNLSHKQCFHSFFEVSQTFTSVSIYNLTETRRTCFYFFQKTPRQKKGKQLVPFHYQNVNSLCSRHHYVNSSC